MLLCFIKRTVYRGRKKTDMITRTLTPRYIVADSISYSGHIYLPSVVRLNYRQGTESTINNNFTLRT